MGVQEYSLAEAYAAGNRKLREGVESRISRLLGTGCYVDAYEWWKELYSREGLNQKTAKYLGIIINQRNAEGDIIYSANDIMQRLERGTLDLEGLTAELGIERLREQNLSMLRERYC